MKRGPATEPGGSLGVIKMDDSVNSALKAIAALTGGLVTAEVAANLVKNLQSRPAPVVVSSGVDYELLKRVIRDEIDSCHNCFSYAKVEVSNDVYTNINSLFDGTIRNAKTGERLWRIDLRKYWSPTEGLTCPEGYRYLVVRTKEAVPYPEVTFRTKLPDMSAYANTDYYACVQLGAGGTDFSLRSMFLYDMTEHLYACKYAHNMNRVVDITSLMPNTYKTELHNYTVKLNRGITEYYIDRKLVAVALPGPDYETISAPPYGILIAPFDVPTHGTSWTEVDAGGGPALTLPLTLGPQEDSGSSFDFYPGDPHPPRIYPLYQAGTNNLFAGYSLSSGSLTSHPVPIFGYQNKTLYFMADKDGTVDVEVYTLSGNWRTYDSVSYTGGKLLTIKMADDALLIRVVYTPTTTPATVSDGVVVMT